MCSTALADIEANTLQSVPCVATCTSMEMLLTWFRASTSSAILSCGYRRGDAYRNRSVSSCTWSSVASGGELRAEGSSVAGLPSHVPGEGMASAWEAAPARALRSACRHSLRYSGSWSSRTNFCASVQTGSSYVSIYTYIHIYKTCIYIYI